MVIVRSALTSGDRNIVGFVEEVGVDDCGVKVVVRSGLTTGENCTAEFVETAGVVEKDVELA
jgi:hypothetical protein